MGGEGGGSFPREWRQAPTALLEYTQRLIKIKISISSRANSRVAVDLYSYIHSLRTHKIDIWPMAFIPPVHAVNIPVCKV